VWKSLASTVNDRDRAAREAEKLFAQYHAVHNCDFLITWMLSDPWPTRISQMPAVVPVLARPRAAAERQAVGAIVLRHLALIVDPLLRQVTSSIFGLFTHSFEYADLISHILDVASDEDLPEELLMVLLGPGALNQVLLSAVEAAISSLTDPALPLAQTTEARIYLLLLAADRLFPALAAALRSRLTAERKVGMAKLLSLLAHA
jgi:hypothetical protein